MPSCSLQHCNARKTKRHPELTLHRFPTNQLSRKKWLDIIGIEKLNPNHKNWYVCSLHFDEKCFNRTLDQIRLRDDTLPSLLIEPGEGSHIKRTRRYKRRIKQSKCTEKSNETIQSLSIVGRKKLRIEPVSEECQIERLLDSDDSVSHVVDDSDYVEHQICRVCLSTTRRVYSLHALQLATTYSALSRVKLHERGRGLPQAACAACAARLRSARQLSERSQRANELLIGLLEKTFKVTPEAVNELVQYDSGLTASTLVPVHFAPGHFDLYIQEEIKDQDDSVEENVGEKDEATEEATIKATEVVAKKTEDFNLEDNSFEEDVGGTVEATAEDAIKATEACTKENENLNLEEPMEDDVTIQKEATDDCTPETDPNVAEETSEGKVKIRDFVRRYFTVQKLSLAEQIREHEKSQLSFNYLESKYKCDMCYKGFISETTFSSHMTRHNKSNGNFECSICHVWLRSRYALCKHRRTHTTLYTCKKCGMTSRNRNFTTHHARWHRGTVYKCSLCTEDITYTRPSSLFSHLRMRHRGTSHCPLCGYGFLGEKGLAQHISYMHPGETIPTEGPRCEECSTIFANDHALAKHHKVIHLRSESNVRYHKRDKRTRQLKFSGFHKAKNIKPRNPMEREGAEREVVAREVVEREEAEREETEREETEKEETEKTFTCEANTSAEASPGFQHVLSGSPFSTPTHLTDHTYMYLGPRYQCHVCGCLLECAETLKDHMSVHAAAPSHACPECGNRYPTRAQMLTHCRTHMKRYVCPLCQKEFRSSQNRDRHYTKVHTTVRDVKCDFCEKMFKCQASRRMHEKYGHMEMPWPKRKRTREPAPVES